MELHVMLLLGLWWPGWPAGGLGWRSTTWSFVERVRYLPRPTNWLFHHVPLDDSSMSWTCFLLSMKSLQWDLLRARAQ